MKKYTAEDMKEITKRIRKPIKKLLKKGVEVTGHLTVALGEELFRIDFDVAQRKKKGRQKPITMVSTDERQTAA